MEWKVTIKLLILFYFQVRDFPAPLNIPTLAPARDQSGPIACRSGPVACRKSEAQNVNISGTSRPMVFVDVCTKRRICRTNN